MTIQKYPLSNKTIVTFKNGSLQGADWLKFILEYKANTELYRGEGYPELWNKFTTMSALDYYRKNLELYNADFKYQMKEFKEGNMLFEIMERNVWSLASQDTVGLLAHYKANQLKYKWAASADVLMVNATDEKSSQETMNAIKRGEDWKKMAEQSEGRIQVDSGRYELNQILDSANAGSMAENGYSPIIKNTDGSAVFVKYLKLYPANQQRSFEEARGLVINDYQNVIEKKWLASLKKISHKNK